MNQSNGDNLIRHEDELRRLDGVKWNRFPSDVLPAWVADMDLAPPSFAVEAVRNLVDRGDFGYNRRAIGLLPEAFSEWQQRYHGWRPAVDETLLFNDVLHAIQVCVWLHSRPGDGVVVLTPIYPPFRSSIAESGRRLVDVALEPEGWRLDPERLADAIDDTTSVLLLCTPHNPTGRVFDDEERQAIGRVVVDNDLMLISDEVWGDVTHPGSVHVPMATVDPAVASRTVTISSASKAFNLAGLRCALAHIGSASLADRFAALPSHFLGEVNSLGAEASLACWTEGHRWLEDTRRFLTDRRDQLKARVDAELPTVGFHQPEATYLAWLDLSAAGLGSDPAALLLDRARIALSSGPDFGENGRGFARLNMATSPQLLDRLVDRLVSVLAEPSR